MKLLRATARFILLALATVGTYTVWFLLNFFIPNKQYWRQVIFSLWSNAFLKIAGMRVEVIGRPPKPPFFLVSNHLSYMDIPVIRSSVIGVFVAKHDLRDWFMAGRMIRDMGTVFINRQNRRDIPRAGSEIIEKLEEGEGVIVFPEGTSSRGEEVLPFNSSFLEFAARCDLPVHYAALSYRTAENDPPASEAISWWDDTPFLKHLFDMLKIKQSTAILNFGEEPIVNPDRKLLAAELYKNVKNRFIPML